MIAIYFKFYLKYILNILLYILNDCVLNVLIAHHLELGPQTCNEECGFGERRRKPAEGG